MLLRDRTRSPQDLVAFASFLVSLNEGAIVCVFLQVIQAGMFNQNSTSGERRAFLEALLENDKDDEEVSSFWTFKNTFDPPCD